MRPPGQVTRLCRRLSVAFADRFCRGCARPAALARRDRLSPLCFGSPFTALLPVKSSIEFHATGERWRLHVAGGTVPEAAVPETGAGPEVPSGPAQALPEPPSAVAMTATTAAADTADASIRAVLPGPAPPAAGRPYAVRWLVDARKAASDLRVQAAREGTGQVYRLSVPGGGVSGQLAEFPSDLVFPASGCWDADVFTGTAQGSLTFRVA